MDFGTKNVELIFEHWPVANVGDGCRVNQKAGQDLTNNIGLITPTTRCSGHAASGAMKRLTNSKTMAVDEVVTFTEGLGPILKHFALSGKSTDSLREALKLMEMKPIRMMTWCPTRMCNILDCSKRTVDMLIPLCDTLISCEVSCFLSPICLSILHLMADLEGKFVGSFLRQLDASDALIVDVFGISEMMVDSLDSFQTSL